MQRGGMQADEVQLVVHGQPAHVVGPVVLTVIPVAARTQLDGGAHDDIGRPRVQLACRASCSMSGTRTLTTTPLLSCLSQRHSWLCSLRADVPTKSRIDLKG